MPEHTDHDFDPLDELRNAWQSLEAPAPADDLADADPETQRTVAWLRAAWQTIEPERELAPPVPAPLLRPRFRPVVLLRLAAAVLVAALAALLWWQPDGAEDAEPVVAGGGPSPTPEQRVPDPERVPEQLVPARTVQFASLTSEKIEMRSGPVRLVLLTGSGQTADGGATTDSSEEDR